MKDSQSNQLGEQDTKMMPRRTRSGHMLCPYYFSWVETSIGINNYQCVDEERSTSCTCDWTPANGCHKFPLQEGGEQ